jgi:hypothetical protein
MKKLIIIFFPLLQFFLSASAQQIKTPAPSPPQYLKQDFGLSAIEVSYSRPGIRGRTIFGDLVPYGKVWRTGANSPTTITFGDDVVIGGTKIAAGKYGLLTIPGEKEWTFIITRQLDVTNPAAYKQDQDIVRVPAPTNALPFSVNNFTMTIDNITNSSCNLILLWDKTAVALPITTDVDTRIMKDIDETINKDDKPYFNAAMYYLDNGKDLNKALEWFNKAIQQNPDGFFIYYQKARCLAKLGKKQDAIATAQKGIESAKAAKNEDYVALNQKLIATLE